ncbi:MAG TPA: VTT domain-containing protein [Bacillota bacterium]|nr:VTT domain-containing protein [Bacillota bacterium]
MVDTVVNFFKEFGHIGMFIHSFIDAIIFPIPAFFSQVSLSMINPANAISLATVGFVACLFGTPIGYWLGKVLGDSLLHKVVKKEWIDQTALHFRQNGEMAILVGAFTPIPFKVFTILSGVFTFSLWKLLVYAAFGRAIKFYAVGILFYVYGRAANEFVTSHLTYIFIVVAIILFIILFLRKKRSPKED